LTFPISGVEVFPAWPFLVALAVSFVTSMGGVSGAFLLLPYQVSALGFTSPGVSSTNLLYNIVAIPGGIYLGARLQKRVPARWIKAMLALVIALFSVRYVVGFFVD
jgi:uncharacterized membrane protein YfcA